MPSLASNLWNMVSGGYDYSPEVMENANQLVAWAAKPYHQKFLDWLRMQADNPLDTNKPHADLIASTARANTFKEIRRYLYDEESKARSALDREHG